MDPTEKERGTLLDYHALACATAALGCLVWVLAAIIVFREPVSTLMGFPLIGGIILAVPSVVLGHVGLAKRRRQAMTTARWSGSRLAVILGYMSLALGLLLLQFSLVASVHETRKEEKRTGLWDNAESTYAAILDVLVEGNQKKAETLLDVAIRKFPGDQRLAFFRGVCARSRFFKSASHLHFQHAKNLNAGTPEGQCARVVMELDARKDVEKNWRALENLVEDHPENSLILWMAAVMCREMGKEGKPGYHVKGVDYYKRLEKHFTVGPVMFHQAYANILSEGLSRHADALVHRRLAARLEPTAYTYQGMANTLSYLGRHDEANEAYEKSISCNSQDPDYWRSWGWGLSRAGKYEEARTKYKKAVHLDSRDHRAWVGLGDCHSKLNQYEEALGCYREAAELGSALGARQAGLLLLHGRGVSRDVVEGYGMLIHAANHGDEFSRKYLEVDIRSGGEKRTQIEQAAEKFLKEEDDLDPWTEELIAKLRI